MAKKKYSRMYLEPLPRENNKDERTPLSGTFTITSIIGFLISVTFMFSGRFQDWFGWSGENAGYTWGFAFTLFFLLMFIASMASITPRGDGF